ncbi:MAG: PH domain-containing protein [Sciscionella sp.]
MRNPAHRVSRKAIGWWAAKSAVGWAIVLVVQALAGVFPDQAPAWVPVEILPVTLAVSAVLALAYLIIVPQWKYRVHRWETTPDAVYTLTGWLNQEWRVAPLSRIQTVDTKRGPLEQLFTLATVTVTTASAAGPLEIAGLDHHAALELVEHLIATTQATPGDAT